MIKGCVTCMPELSYPPYSLSTHFAPDHNTSSAAHLLPVSSSSSFGLQIVNISSTISRHQSHTPWSSPFRRLRLFRTSLDRNTLYSNHPDTQFGPYSPAVAPRVKKGRVKGPAFCAISMIPHRWRSGRIWCQKKGGRVDGSFATLSRRCEVSSLRRL